MERIFDKNGDSTNFHSTLKSRFLLNIRDTAVCDPGMFFSTCEALPLFDLGGFLLDNIRDTCSLKNFLFGGLTVLYGKVAWEGSIFFPQAKNIRLLIFSRFLIDKPLFNFFSKYLIFNRVSLIAHFLSISLELSKRLIWKLKSIISWNQIFKVSPLYFLLPARTLCHIASCHLSTWQQ